jgi:hypothetical protein
MAPASDTQSVDGNRASIIRGVAHLLDPAMSSRNSQSPRAYVACFCESGDLLSQWRSDGGDSGYAIGFRSALLSGQGSEQYGGVTQFCRVTYGLDAACPRIDSVIESVRPMRKRTPEFRLGTRLFMGYFLSSLKSRILPSLRKGNGV